MCVNKKESEKMSDLSKDLRSELIDIINETDVEIEQLKSDITHLKKVGWNSPAHAKAIRNKLAKLIARRNLFATELGLGIVV